MTLHPDNARARYNITFSYSDTGFILGSAVKHPYDLVTGYYSVHTSQDALREGESNIAVIGRRLHNQGVLGARVS